MQIALRLQKIQSSFIDVLANDTDPNEDQLSIRILSQPTHGELMVNDHVLRYTPNHNFFGYDTFEYQAYDGTNYSLATSVVIDVSPVNDSPQASNDTAITNKNMSVTINVLANDIDVDGDQLRVLDFSTPSSGLLTLSSNTLSYTPNFNFYGDDSFIYRIGDDHQTFSTGLVEITINDFNYAPIAVADSFSTTEDIGSFIDVLSNDMDPDGDQPSIHYC